MPAYLGSLTLIIKGKIIYTVALKKTIIDVQAVYYKLRFTSSYRDVKWRQC